MRIHEKMSGDTTPDVYKRVTSMLASRSPAERLRMASRMFATAKALVRIGLEQQNQELDEREIRTLIFLRLYRRDFSTAEINQIITSMPGMKLRAIESHNAEPGKR